MTKEITKAIILQEVQDKFKLRDFEPAKFLFDETVVPIYNVDQHLGTWWNKYVQVSITGTGPITCFYVPSTEKWRLSRYDVVFMGAGAYTVAGVYVRRLNRDPNDAFVYLNLTAAQTVSYHVELPRDVILQPNDQIAVNIDGYTTTQNLRLYVDVMTEEVR